MRTSEECLDDTRRRLAVRGHTDAQGKPDLNGIDYLEVSENDQRVLQVHLMDKAPENITRANVRIQGGQRIRNIQVMDVQLCAPDDPEQADCVQITVDRAGDFSTYTLCLVALDEQGHPTEHPLAGFDPRYACLDFSFKANCPSDLDCQTDDTCPPTALVEPEINYLAKDYASFRQLLLDRLALVMPDWQERHIPDFGITLVELMAYVGDYLSYYQDAVATEAYLETARQRISVRRHVRLVDYRMHEGCNARAWLTLALTGNPSYQLTPGDVYFITGLNNALPVGSTILTGADLRKIPGSSYEVFEPLVVNPQQPITLYEAHNEIHFYTWGGQECCLPRGATSATLDDSVPTPPAPAPKPNGQGTGEQGQQEPTTDTSASPAQQSAKAKRKSQQLAAQETPASAEATGPARNLHLQVGDMLIFEEVLGPKTGVPADADPTHRHVVRLTSVELGMDPLYNIPVVEIAWGPEDALPFPLCLSTIGPAPDCKLLENISVARGNVMLVDHGKTVQEDLGSVATLTTVATCEGEGNLGDVQVLPAIFRPRLGQTPLTFSQPLPPDAPFSLPAASAAQHSVSLSSAASLLVQAPRQAAPQVSLSATPPALPSEEPPSAQDTAEDEDEEEDNPAEEPEAESGGVATLASTAVIWTAQNDLLESGGEDHHFVVEIDNDSVAHLRFGDGELGSMPDAGWSFQATYRVGNGLAGNVGAEAISHAVFRTTKVSGIGLQPRNPLAAVGGTAQEPLAEVKMFAPYAFRSVLERAITPDDYAQLAERNPKVQRAAATLRWTGSWYEVLVAIDPLGMEEADQALLDEITAYLEQFRRIGHDLRVVSARHVPLDVVMDVCVQPNVLRGHVKAALLETFSNRILPDGRLGFFHPDNLTFGEGVALSKLVATAQAVPGVQSVKVTKLERLYEGPNGELEQEFLPLRPMEIAQLDNDPNFPEHGRLIFKMGGGR